MSFGGELPITGYSMCNSLGRNTDEVAKSLAASHSGLGEPPFRLPFKTVCGVVRGELPAPASRHSDYDTRQARIALLTLEGIRPSLDAAVSRWGTRRVALVIATSTGGIAASENAYEEFRNSGTVPDGYDFERQHTFFAFVRLLAEMTGVSGPCYVVSTACSSSGKVLGSAQRLIGSGVVDAVLVGGVDSLALTTLCGFAGLSVLSPTNCRPFSSERNGMNIGEGGAMLLVERDGDARALLLGVGESSDAHHMSTPHPEGLGARSAMLAALEQACVNSTRVDYINAHGTGTLLNDASEARAIFDVFGDRVPVSSTKGFTGHMLGAAGATELLFTIMAIEQGWVPANLGGDPVDPNVPVKINLERTRRTCRVAMSTSFGFGGSNAAVIVGVA